MSRRGFAAEARAAEWPDEPRSQLPRQHYAARGACCCESSLREAAKSEETGRGDARALYPSIHALGSGKSDLVGVSRCAGHLGCDRIAATVVEHVDLAWKPLRLRGFLFDLRNLVCAHQESSTRVL